MPNDQKFIKRVNTSNGIPHERRESLLKAGDGTMTFMVWSIAGTVLAACGGLTRGLDISKLGGSGTTEQSGPASNGTFQDGPADGARFFINRNGDVNGDVVYDDGVDTSLGVTNAEGNTDFGEHSIQIGDVVFVDANGAIDIATGEILSGVWKSLPYDGSGEILVSPLTDLLADATPSEQQTMLNGIFGEGVITVEDVLNRDNYNPFDDEVEAQLISRAAIALTEIEEHDANAERAPTLSGVFATYRTGGLNDGDVPLANVVSTNNTAFNLKGEIDARLAAAADRGEAPVIVEPNGGEPIGMIEGGEVRIADLLNSYTVSGIEGSAEEYLFGFANPFVPTSENADSLQGIYIQAESVNSGIAVVFRQDGIDDAALDDVAETVRGVPQDGPIPAMASIGGEDFYFVHVDHLDQLVLKPDNDDVQGDFQVRFYVYGDEHATAIVVDSNNGGGLLGVGVLNIEVAPVNDAPTAIVSDMAEVGDTTIFIVPAEVIPEAGVLITTFTTADPDQIDVHTYSISGADAGHFRLDGNQLFLSASAAADVPAEGLSFTVTSTDVVGLSVSRDLTVQELPVPSLATGADLDVVSGSDTEASGQITQLNLDDIQLFGSGSGNDDFVSSSDAINDQLPIGTVLTGTYGNMYLRADGSWDYRLTTEAYTLAGSTGMDTFQVRYGANGPTFDIDIAVEGPPALALTAPSGTPGAAHYHFSGRSADGGTFQAALDGVTLSESDLTYGMGLTEEDAIARLAQGGPSHQVFNAEGGRFSISSTGTWSYTLLDPELFEAEVDDIDAFRAGTEHVQKIWVAARSSPNGAVGTVEVDVPIRGLAVVEGPGGSATIRNIVSDQGGSIELLLGTGHGQLRDGQEVRGSTVGGRDQINAAGDSGDINLIVAYQHADTINLDKDTTDIIYHRIETGPGPNFNDRDLPSYPDLPGLHFTTRNEWRNNDGADTINNFVRGQDKIVFVDLDTGSQTPLTLSLSNRIDRFIDLRALINRSTGEGGEVIETIIGFEFDFVTDNSYSYTPGHGDIKVLYHEDDHVITGVGLHAAHAQYFGNNLGDYEDPRGGGQPYRDITDISKWQNYFGADGFEVISGALPSAIQAEIDRHLDPSTGQYVDDDAPTTTDMV